MHSILLILLSLVFKDWLKQSLLKDREEARTKKEQKRHKILEKEKAKRIKAKNRVEAEISFKRWKINKDRQLAKEERQKLKLEEEKKQQEAERHVNKYKGQILLAYTGRLSHPNPCRV